jgi:hypothetical protein
MDPTLEDTDADGFPDGWEYYFWYQAHVWVPADTEGHGRPRNGQAFVFERFNLAEILVGTEIPLDEVEKRFNPCEPVDPKDFADNPDFDKDGLSDLEELAIGTNPAHWDTDGDHMCDGWEVMMCLDPLDRDDKTGNGDGDFMAYRDVMNDMCWIDPATATAVTDENGVITNFYAEGIRIYALVGIDPILDVTVDDAGAKVMARDREIACFSFTPKYKDGANLVYGTKADSADRTIWGANMVDLVICGRITMHEGDPLYEKLNYILVHDQVHDAFGFDPRTAWHMTKNGYVSDRWDPGINHKAGQLGTGDAGAGATGIAVNTRPYQNYDEYLVMKYRVDYGIDYAPNTSGPTPNAANDDAFNGEKETIWAYVMRKTTNPSKLLASGASSDGDENSSTNSTSSTEAASASVAERIAELLREAGKPPVTSHGADTDGDGVSDGW